MKLDTILKSDEWIKIIRMIAKDYVPEDISIHQMESLI